MDTLFLLIAIGPAALLMIYAYRKDRLELESKKLLKRLVIFGGLSIIPAMILELIGTKFIIGMGYSGLAYIVVENFIVVALVEEGCKYVVLRFLTWKNEEFNCSYDGLLYAIFVSMGFAIVENVLYVLESGLLTGLIRAVTSIPGHCFFGVFMGTRYAAAKRADYRGEHGKAAILRLQAVIFPVLIHGAYDFLLSVESESALIVFVVLLIALYIIGLKAINRASRNDAYMIQDLAIQHELKEHWNCPVCGTENDSVFCSYCKWRIPMSGIIGIPEKPGVEPILTVSEPRVQVPKEKRAQPKKSALAGAAVFIITFAVCSHSDFSDPKLVIGLVLTFVLTIVLPIYLSIRNENQAKQNDPEYQKAYAFYREELRIYEESKKAYEGAVAAWDDYHSCRKFVEKKGKRSV